MLYINTKVSDDITNSIFRVEEFQSYSESTWSEFKLRNLLY